MDTKHMTVAKLVRVQQQLDAELAARNIKVRVKIGSVPADMRIQAIKLVRDLAGLALGDAVNAVDTGRELDFVLTTHASLALPKLETMHIAHEILR